MRCGMLRTPRVWGVTIAFPRDPPCKVDEQLAYPPTKGSTMKVWIDQDLCTGDGLCEEIAPGRVHPARRRTRLRQGGGTIYATAKGNPQGAEGLANIPDGQLDAVIESAEECPGECIYIEP